MGLARHTPSRSAKRFHYRLSRGGTADRRRSLPGENGVEWTTIRFESHAGAYPFPPALALPYNETALRHRRKARVPALVCPDGIPACCSGPGDLGAIERPGGQRGTQSPGRPASSWLETGRCLVWLGSLLARVLPLLPGRLIRREYEHRQRPARRLCGTPPTASPAPPSSATCSMPRSRSARRHALLLVALRRSVATPMGRSGPRTHP